MDLIRIVRISLRWSVLTAVVAAIVLTASYFYNGHMITFNAVEPVGFPAFNLPFEVSGWWMILTLAIWTFSAALTTGAYLTLATKTSHIFTMVALFAVCVVTWISGLMFMAGPLDGIVSMIALQLWALIASAVVSFVLIPAIRWVYK